MITVFCSKCGNELSTAGGLMFSPPTSNIVTKFHLCQKCWELILSSLTQPNESEIDDAINKLTNICQLIDGWHGDGTNWSEFDETCRKDASELLKRFYKLKGITFGT